MLTKKAYTLEEVILYLEALEMLDIVYRVEKFPSHYDEQSGKTYHNVWVIEYEQGEDLQFEESAIEFED